MKYFFLPTIMTAVMIACKTTPDSNRNYVAENKIYKLHLSPLPGSAYRYSINNETGFTLEIDDKKTTNRNETDVGVKYEINKDSAGNFILSTNYDKIHLYSKNGDQETEMDADNASFSMNPVEKMLGPLRTATVTVTVSPTGELKSLSGYKETGK